MGSGHSKPTANDATPSSDLVITGLCSQWPDRLIGPEDLQTYAEKWYGSDEAWLRRLIKINQNTGIETRAIVDLWQDSAWNRALPPTAEEVDEAFRIHGVKLSALACRKAIEESSLSVDQITHVVAVTATNAGSPGYDQLVAHELNLPYSAERVLLNGIGCAGGLAALRVAANIASACAHRNVAARVLVCACELCSIHIRAELEAARLKQDAGIGSALFGDGAGALVLCNTAALGPTDRGLYSLTNWHSSIIPGTSTAMAYQMTTLGFVLHLSKQVPGMAAAAVVEPFKALCNMSGMDSATPQDFDWALHPGGLSVITGVKKAMQLSNEALRASYEVYRSRGNSSSVAVLAVLDTLRNMGEGRENVVACSFGPGLTVEMALLKRLRPVVSA